MRKLAALSDLTGRVAVITGGAGHLGLAFGETLAEMGATVIVVDYFEEAVMRRVDHLRAFGSPCHGLTCDLSDTVQTRAMIHRAHEICGRLDILIHSAAIAGITPLSGWREPLEKQTEEAWNAAMQLNLTAAFSMVQEARPFLKASGNGSVIFVSSIYGRVGPDMRLYEGTTMANPIAYGVTKAGLMQLARHFATELAPEIRVNTLSPGGIWRAQPESFVQRYEERTPLRRMAKEEDFKGAVAFLASDLSAYVTGQDLVIDGGWTAW